MADKITMNNASNTEDKNNSTEDRNNTTDLKDASGNGVINSTNAGSEEAKKAGNKIDLHGKTILVFTIMFILFVPISIILFAVGQYFSLMSETEQEMLKVDELTRIVSHADDMSMAAQKQYDHNLSKELEIIVSMLQEDVTGDRYTGPEILSSGFMVRLNGDSVEIPDALPSGEMKITKTSIVNSLSSGAVRTERFVVDASEEEPLDDDVDNGLASENIYSYVTDYDAEYNLDAAYDVSSLENVYYLSFAQVTENDIYVHTTPADEFSSYLKLYTSDSLDALKNIASLSNCMVALLEDTGDGIQVLKTYSNLEDIDQSDLSDITSYKFVSNTISDITLNDKKYRCICAEADGRWIGQNRVFVVQFFPRYSFRGLMALQSAIVCLLMLVIFITLIVYALAEQRYVIENIMTTEQAKRYNPVKLKRKVINAGLTGAIGIFIFAFLTQAVSQMQQETRNGKDIMQFLSGNLEESVQVQEKRIKRAQEEWYVHTCQRIASFCSDRPELASSEKLAEFNNILESDFLMLFDSTGNEIVSSNDYIGFKLNLGLGPNSSDFRNLLLGMPSIVHDVSTDSSTNLSRQYIGVTMDAIDNPEKHGALIICLMPGQTNVADNITDASAEMALALTEQTLCFNVNEATREIIHSSDASMEGKDIKDCGLEDVSLQDGYMDFGVINSSRYFIVTSRINKNIFYYAMDYSSLLRENLLFSLTSIALYLLALIVIIIVLLKEYNKDSYKKLAVVLMPGITLNKKTIRASAGTLAAASGTADGSAEPADITSDAGKKAAGIENKISNAVDETADMMDELVEDDSYKHNVIQSKAEFLGQKVQQMAKKRLPVIDFVIKQVQWDTRLPEEKGSLVFYIGMFFLLQLWIYFMMVRNGDVSMFDYLLYGDWSRGVNTFSLYCILLFIAIANLVVTISSWVLHMAANFLTPKGATICNLLRSIIKYISVIVVIFLSLSYIGVLTSAVIASVGIGSLIISLGSKDIVADVLCGILIVFEQTMRIGDFVMYQDKYCIVREVGMRTTKLEIQPGKDIFEVRNHEIVSVINMSINAGVCSLSLNLRASESLEKVEKVVNQGLVILEKECPQIIDKPKYLGLTKIGSDAKSLMPMMTVAIAARCDQKNYYMILNKMNKIFFSLFEENGIALY